MSTGDERIEPDAVGPVLRAGAAAAAVVGALLEAHPDARVIDRGSYLRVLVPGRCRVDRAGIERHLGGRFRLPADLERIMASFKGHFTVTTEEASWELSASPRHPT